MANSLYDTAKEGFLGSEIRWDDPTVIKAALVRGYTHSAAHRFMSDVTGAGGTIVATSPALTGKTKTDGAANAADTTFTAVPTGAAIPALIVFQASAWAGGADAAPTAQRLIAYIDTGTNLPVTPNGGDIISDWQDTLPHIFAL